MDTQKFAIRAKTASGNTYWFNIKPEGTVIMSFATKGLLQKFLNPVKVGEEIELLYFKEKYGKYEEHASYIKSTPVTELKIYPN